MKTVLLLVAAGWAAVLCATPAGAQDDVAAQLFARACGKCHGTAEIFLYQSVTRSGEVLTGVETGIPVADYLHAGHGKLSEVQVAELMVYFEALETAQ